MGLEESSQIAKTVTRLLMSGPVAQENWEKLGTGRDGTGRDGTTQYHSGEVLNGFETKSANK